MAQIVKFVNRSGERVSLYREDGSILKILENIGWDRNPKSGTLRTTTISEHEAPPPPQPDPVWIDETEWLWEDCPDDSIYAPFKTIIFLDANKVKLKKRLFWKFPEMKWPCVTFLFRSEKMKMFKVRLEREHSVLATIFHNGIPTRRTVNPLSKYAEFKRWFFIEQPVKTSSNRQMPSTEILEYGEIVRSSTEILKIGRLKAKAEEREKAKLV